MALFLKVADGLFSVMLDSGVVGYFDLFVRSFAERDLGDREDFDCSGSDGIIGYILVSCFSKGTQLML